MSLVLKNEDLETKPIFEDEGVSYVSIKYNDLIRTFTLFSFHMTPHLTPIIYLLKNSLCICFYFVFLARVVMAVTKKNTDASMILLFLHMLIKVRPFAHKRSTS